MRPVVNQKQLALSRFRIVSSGAPDGNIVLVGGAPTNRIDITFPQKCFTVGGNFGVTLDITLGGIDPSTPVQVFWDWTNDGNVLPVGGIAELPEVAVTPLETGRTSGGNAGVLPGVAGAWAAGAVVLGGPAWYARRRWVQ